MRKVLALLATGLILTFCLLSVGSVLAADPTISITPDTCVAVSSGDSVRIWIAASDPDPLDMITVEKSFGAGTYDPRTELAPIYDEFFFQPDTAGLYTFIFPVTDEHGATAADTTHILVSDVQVDFRQAANDDSPYPPGDVHWIGSILQPDNSTYDEGMSSLQRVVLVGIPKLAGDSHVLSFHHEANKDTCHAYDFITSWPQGLQAGSEIGGPTMFVNLNQCGPEIGPPADLGAICADLHANGFTATPDAPDAMETLLGDDVAASVAAYEAQLGNRTVKIYGNAPISAASIIFNGYTGITDKLANYMLTWTSSSDSVVIEMAAHLAAGIDPVGQPGVGYGEGKGSAGILGTPYFFRVSTLDCFSLDLQDNLIVDVGITSSLPECNVTPSSQEVCDGSFAAFSDNTTGGTPPYTYCWQKSPYTDPCVSTTSQLTFASAALADGGDYRVIVTDAKSFSDTCYVTLVVHPTPTCSIDPPSANISGGDSQEFCVQPTGGTPPYTYLWSPGGEVTQCITVSPPAGTHTYWVQVTDAGDCTTSCEATVAVECCPSVWIGTVDCVDPGDYVEVPIHLECTPAFCGFELEVEFDYTSMTFVGAKRGRLIPEGEFEEFTYRLLPCPLCGCCKYKILLFGMCDLPNSHHGVPIPELAGADTLVLLSFVVNSDENLRGLMIPICWEWEGNVDPQTGCLVEDWNCQENTFSSVTGDTLYTSRLCCQFVDSICDDPSDRISSIMRFQPDTNCVSDCYRICGGIAVCPAGPGVCKRGDVNMNTITYEAADAVLFASYFVEGLSVFRYDLAYQVCATDVNADGRTLTLSDLVYLIRVILHDAVEIPKVTPSSEVANVIVEGGTISTECAAPIGAILFEFDTAVNPTLLADMEMVHKGNKVLVWSSEGKSFTSAQVLTADAELVSVSAVDPDSRELNTTITAKVAPTAFALHPAYPNPFNPFVNLSFTLPEAASYSLNIYNVAGQLVKSYSGVGSQSLNVVTWDGKDNSGSEVSSGIYFYKLTAAGFSATEKMVMMK